MSVLNDIKLPEVGQRVLMLVCELDEFPAQLHAKISAVSEEGALEVRVFGVGDTDRLPVDASVYLEYERAGVVYHLATTIERNGAHVGWLGQSQPFVSLAAPCAGSGARRFSRRRVSLPVRFVPVSLPSGFSSNLVARGWLVRRWARALEAHGESGNTLVLSATGACVNATAEYDVGEELFIETSLDGEPVQLAGRVVWRGERNGGPAIGVAFVGVASAARGRIDDYVRRS